MKGGGAKTASNSMSYYLLPHVSFYSSARFIELTDLLGVRVAIAKVFSCTFHLNTTNVHKFHLKARLKGEEKVG